MLCARATVRRFARALEVSGFPIPAWSAPTSVTDAIAAYVVDLLAATRAHPQIRLGASTRGGVSLIALGRARAALRGRNYVVPDDIAATAVPALAHRVAGSNATVESGRELVAECLASLTPPTV